MKREITKKDYEPLIHYRSIYDELKNNGEKALHDIHTLLQEVQKNNKNPLGPIKIINVTSNEIIFKYLNIHLYVHILINLIKGIGYIEWGLYNEKNDFLKYERINTDEFDMSGSINKTLTTIDFAHILIPNALIKSIKDSATPL